MTVRKPYFDQISCLTCSLKDEDENQLSPDLLLDGAYENWEPLNVINVFMDGHIVLEITRYIYLFLKKDSCIIVC